ncbi:MAG: hypothetical protein JNK81_01935 [Anaerolineales bacterium]|nr:hypothetical protein [Anaerolineales bacterium]
MQNRSLSFILLFLILVGCSRSLKPTELDVLGTEDCKPPCWRGITPGKITVDETITIFQNWQVENKGMWKRNTGTNNVISWDYVCWRDRVGPQICLEVGDNNLISKVDLRFYSSSLKLEDIIEIYGQPDGYKIDLCPDCSGYGISIYYIENGLIFSFGASGKLQITPKMKFSRALFLDQETIEIYKEGYIEWSGYGPISLNNNK